MPSVNQNKLGIALHRLNLSVGKFLDEYRRRPQEVNLLDVAEMDLIETETEQAG